VSWAATVVTCSSGSSGETVIMTRAGVPVGELCPLLRPRLTATALLAWWRSVPKVDPVRLPG
jgi:antitoxin (DNA-binding transcriptional repressor) of toxin-antitoxin stability system